MTVADKLDRPHFKDYMQPLGCHFDISGINNL